MFSINALFTYWLQLRMLGLLLAVCSAFAVIVLCSLLIVDFEVRRIAIGFLSCASLISMFASPLFVIVCQTFYLRNISLITSLIMFIALS